MVKFKILYETSDVFKFICGPKQKEQSPNTNIICYKFIFMFILSTYPVSKNMPRLLGWS